MPPRLTIPRDLLEPGQERILEDVRLDEGQALAAKGIVDEPGLRAVQVVDDEDRAHGRSICSRMRALLAQLDDGRHAAAAGQIAGAAEERHAREAPRRGRPLGGVGGRGRRRLSRAPLLLLGRLDAHDRDRAREPHRPEPDPGRPGARCARADPATSSSSRDRSRPIAIGTDSGARGRARAGDGIRPAHASRRVRLPADHAPPDPGLARGERARRPRPDAARDAGWPSRTVDLLLAFAAGRRSVTTVPEGAPAARGRDDQRDAAEREARPRPERQRGGAARRP